MNTIIETLDGRYYDLEALGIITRDFVPSAPSVETQYESVDGRHGLIAIDTTYGARDIKGVFYMRAEGYEDYAERRDEVFAIFSGLQPYYITESRTHGKRWLVRTDGTFTLEQEWRYGFFDVAFKASSPFAESINAVTRRFTTTSFRFRNDGNVTIDPRTQDESFITFKGASNGLVITNNTTGDVWSYNGTTGANDVLMLRGVKSLKNNASVFGATNKRLITIAPGNNEFTITGASGPIEITVNTRFYFL